MQMNSSIDEVAKAVRRCRAEGLRTYPDTVWSAIGALRKRHPVPELSRRFGISSQYLAKRLGCYEAPAARFCELPAKAALPAGLVGAATEIVVRRADGSEMAVRVQGSVELASMVSAFAWGAEEVRP